MINIFSQRFFVASLVLCLSALLFWISYFQDNAEVYLFPAIVTSGVLVLGISSFIREAFNLCVDDIKPIAFFRLIPALVLIFAAVFSIEDLGMYTTCALVLFLLSALYSPTESMLRRVFGSVMLAIGFSLFMYLLFSVTLNVQTPRGFFI